MRYQGAEPVRPTTREEAVTLLRHRADVGRRASFGTDFNSLPANVQRALYGIAAQLEYIADFIEDER